MNRKIIIGLIIFMVALAAYKYHTHLQSPTIGDSVVIQTTTSECSSSNPGADGCACTLDNGDDDNSLCASGNCHNGKCRCNHVACPCFNDSNCASDYCEPNQAQTEECNFYGPNHEEHCSSGISGVCRQAEQE